MPTFTLPTSIEDSRTGRVIEAGKHVTDDPAEIRLLRRHPGHTEEATRDELAEKARDLDIKGRSTMGRDELEQAVEKAAPDTE